MKNPLKKSFMLALSLLMASGALSYADVTVSRISGKDRYETAMKVDKDCFWTDGNRSKLAVISNGEIFRESLYGSHIASSLGAHFYPTVKGYISKAILNEIKSSGVKYVYVMGTYNQLSKSIDNTLKSNGIEVIRLFDGKYMYDMKRPIDDLVSIVIYESIKKNNPYGDIASSIIINDSKFPDVVAAVPFASRLSYSSGLHLYSSRYYDNSNYGNVSGAHFIIGGFSSVPRRFTTGYEDSELGLNEVSSDSRSSDIAWNYTGRLAGRDRYETAVKIAEAYPYVFKTNYNAAIIVSGENYADALSSSLESVFNKCPILLTERNRLNQYTKKYLMENGIEHAIIVGGENSVSKNAENELKTVLDSNKNK